MNRKLLIFGNGLGMSLDHNYFSLDTALKSIWDDEKILSDETKSIIETCTGHKGAPAGEEELDKLHLAITSCETVQRLGLSESLLTSHGKNLPIQVGSYIFYVAKYFTEYDGRLPEEFTKPLNEFILRTKSHVATLNYDTLLYQEFADSSVFGNSDIGSYQTAAIMDGMQNRGFHPNNLARKDSNPNNFGYYLHLHGSPLFYDSSDGKTYKYTRDKVSKPLENPGKHIVLTHVKNKPQVISQSEVLFTYWRYLYKAIREVKQIIIMGYSGKDSHLNRLINDSIDTHTVKIIEWSGNSEGQDRTAYWKNIFIGHENQVELIHRNKITDFHDW